MIQPLKLLSMIILVSAPIGAQASPDPNVVRQETSLWEYFENSATPQDRQIDALEELQKLYYSEGKWERFFALSVFYRAKNYPFRETMIAREVLALAKHCRWRDALDILSHQENHPSQILDQIARHLVLQEKFANELKTKESKPNSTFVFEKNPQWKIQTARLSQIQSPKLLRMAVESRCEK